MTNGVLGSINHTILSLEAIKSRGIRLAAVIYNEHFDTDRIIGADSQAFTPALRQPQLPGHLLRHNTHSRLKHFLNTL